MKIIVTFTRPDTTAPFFYHEFADHLVVTTLHDKFEAAPGFLGKEILVEEELKTEVAMNFESMSNFFLFAKSNQQLLDMRRALVEEWCQTNGHTFEHRIITDEPMYSDIPLPRG